MIEKTKAVLHDDDGCEKALSVLGELNQNVLLLCFLNFSNFLSFLFSFFIFLPCLPPSWLLYLRLTHFIVFLLPPFPGTLIALPLTLIASCSLQDASGVPTESCQPVTFYKMR